MANLSNTSWGESALRGVTGAIQNVGAIQGIQRSNEQAAREEGLYGLQKANLERQGVIQNMQLETEKMMNTPVDLDEVRNKMFKNKPNSLAVFNEAIAAYETKDKTGRSVALTRDFRDVSKMLHTVEWGKERAIAKMADKRMEINSLAPEMTKDATGKEVPVPEDPRKTEARELKIKMLKGDISEIEKEYKLAKEIGKWVVDPKTQQWIPLDKNGQVMEELAKKGYIPDSAFTKPTPQIKPVQTPEGVVYKDVMGGANAPSLGVVPPATDKNKLPYTDPNGKTVLVDTSSPDAQATIDRLKLKPASETAARLRVEAFGTVPQGATGTYFDKIKKEWKMNTENGPVTLTSEQVKNLGLQAKEEITTADIKVMQQSAPAVLGFTKKVNDILSSPAMGPTGPAASRWREMWAGKVGASDPEFTKLRTNISLLETRLMKMHVGARGGEYMMKHFQDLLDYGKQSPENMRAAIKEIEDYAKEVAMPVNKGMGGAVQGINKPDPLGIR
jgi:hypothetical protein